VLFPFLNGQDLNTNPDQSPSRWIINFFDWPFEKASNYPECLQILTEKVKPFRDEVVNRGRQIHEYDYWKYWDKRPFLYKTISNFDSIMAISRVTKFVCFAFLESNMIFSDAVVVFAFQEFKSFAVLSSTFHNDWAWKYSSTMGGSTLRYSPTDAFETFPFPSTLTTIENTGKQYYEFRKQIMQENQIGLTNTYNRFHKPKEKSSDIAHLRELHVEMDNAVSAAYGWNDLDLGHGFHETPQGVRFTISEEARREVLARLLQLNHERYEEEVRQGLHEDKKGKKKEKPGKKAKTTREDPGQYGLF